MGSRGPQRIYSDDERKARAAERTRAKYHANKEYRERARAKAEDYAKKYPEKCVMYKKNWSDKNDRDYRLANPEVGRRARSAFCKKYPEKLAAWTALSNAVAAGKVVRGLCEVCGSEKVDGHHDDYSKPLEVRWLCKKHHAEHHKLNRISSEVKG